MRHLILFSTLLLFTMHAGAQSARKTRTITTSFSKNGTISGDTTFFSYYDQNQDNGRYDALTRYFNRNLRMSVTEYDEWEVGTCNLYFIIDTAGKVTQTWCDSVTNNVVEKEVLRVANRLPILRPTKIKGKPVLTKVMATVIMTSGKDMEPYTGPQADIVVIGYSINKKTVQQVTRPIPKQIPQQ